MARPKKHTDQVISDIVDGVSKGLTLKAACKYAGVSYSSLANWLSKGKQAKLRGEINQYTEILDRINVGNDAVYRQHHDQFFFNLSPRDYRYGWRNPMSYETRVKLSEAWHRNQEKRREMRRWHF